LLKRILKYETIFSKREFIKEIWASFPIWFFYIESIGVLNFMMANVDPAKYEALGYRAQHFGLMVLFPLAWVIGYYLLRVKKSDRIVEKVYFSFVLPALLFVPVLIIFFLYTLFPFLRVLLREDTLRLLFECMQIFWIILFLIHCLTHFNLQKFATFFVVGFVYGLLLENSGIFLGYFSEPHYLFYLWKLPAPYVTMVGWCIIFYCCTWIASFFRDHFTWFKKTPLRSAFLTTSIALSLDMQVDPLASLSGVFWKWNDVLPVWFLGVPFCNYAAWFGAFMPFAWAYYYLEGRADLTETQRNWKLFVHIPLIALIAGMIWLLLMTIYEGGFGGPTYQILNAFFDKILPYPT
jgi:hypothetical protein